MKKDMLIKNGHIIDPANGRDALCDLYIHNGRIVAPQDCPNPEIVIDATGKYVFPGLIDYHAHVFKDSTDIGIDTDRNYFPQGVTAVVDAGSAGVSTMKTFISDVVERSFMNVQCYLNLCPAGLATMKYHESYDPAYWDLDRMAEYLATYPDIIQGLKIRISKPIIKENGFEIFKQAAATARQLGTRLCVHVTKPPVDMGQVASVLDVGDVLAHCFHGTGNTIIGEDGKVLPGVQDAKARGVVMDAANGGNHWSFAVAGQALADGFKPDIISTDITGKTLFKDPVFSLPYIMSKYLLLGLSLYDVIAACTATPAKLMHGKERLGTLSIGAQADVAVFDLVPAQIVFSDTLKEKRTGQQVLEPLMTICKGEAVYRNITF
ncbi:amidohydrolase family protein [Megasphaera hominis]|uniref:Amidohydrolase family protein n=1 Tax=Megasphaera hominis TaxID=159836 RepID=A0ABR6VJE8_9FIRM|nr:amidohydrolase family protein [Megasphaera hominis]MBC3537406.1 amidohydrolase family protein [Megasphaera hominis]